MHGAAVALGAAVARRGETDEKPDACYHDIVRSLIVLCLPGYGTDAFAVSTSDRDAGGGHRRSVDRGDVYAEGNGHGDAAPAADAAPGSHQHAAPLSGCVAHAGAGAVDDSGRLWYGAQPIDG